MNPPNAEHAIVDRAKIVDYLLSDAHEDGRHKAVFFKRFGFRPRRWQELADALKQHVVQNEVAREESSPFGRRFVVEGIMHMPDGRTPFVRSIWFLRTNEITPRFVTAYPIRPRAQEQVQ